MTCLGIGIMVVGSIIGYAAAGGQGVLAAMLLGGTMLIVDFFPSKEEKEAKVREEAQQKATARSQEMWQQAARTTTAIPCKTCGESVAPLAVVCSKCGVTLPGLRIGCPKCGSESISVGKKGFSVGQAAVGGIAVGPVGLAAGMIGSKDTELVCLSCNNRWKASASQKAPTASTISEATPSLKAPVPQRPLTAVAAAKATPAVKTKKAGLKAEGMYTWIDDIKKYRCDYCYKDGRYHYCKTLKGIKNHVTEAHLDR